VREAQRRNFSLYWFVTGETMKKFVAKSDIIVKDLILSKGTEVIVNDALEPLFPPESWGQPLVRIIVPLTDKISYSCVIGPQVYFNRNFEEVK